MKKTATSTERSAPPSERPAGVTLEDALEETTHTDPGPVIDEPGDSLDWNDAEDRYAMIAEAAYYKAEQRGFELSDSELDWLEAEQELIDRMEQEAIY